MVELHDIENDEYYAWDTVKFFGFDKDIFSYEYSLFEIENTNTYIIAVVESGGLVNGNEFADHSTLRKFQFGNFSSSPYIQLKGVKTKDKWDDRVISAFRLDSKQLIVLFFLKQGVGYASVFYDDNLNYKGYMKFSDVTSWNGWGIFNKGIHVKDDYAAFIYFTNAADTTNSLKFKFMVYEDDYKFTDKITRDFSSYQFQPNVYANGFQKLTDERLVFFSETDSFKQLHMFLFDFFDNYKGIKIREYKFTYTNQRFAKEIQAYMYNGYILFSATLGEISNDPQNIFAIMMIFGFANGTDSIIDISPYLMDTGYYNSENNLYNYLMSTMTIDNNIFNYEKVEKIRLISICDELLLYKGKLNVDKEENVLPLNELFDANHTLLQNRNITKTENKLYSLVYQFIVKEPNFTTLYESAHVNIDDLLNSVKAEEFYTPKTLDGRTNILQFKLCHKFCINCIEYGPSDNDQRCVNCKENYTYDYLANVNRFTGNCVPYDYMYDVENKKLQFCNSTSYKYYYNITRNRTRYCFKYDYECPSDYHFLNETNNECIDYTLPTTVLKIPTTIPKIPTTVLKIPTTIPKIPTTIPKIPTTIPKIPTTIPKIPTTIPKIPTTIPKIPTTFPKTPTTIPKIPTTIPAQIPTTIQNKIITTLPKIISTIPIIPTTIPKIIPTTIIQDQCKYGILINHTSSFSNLSNDDIYQITRNNIISTYCINGSSVFIAGSNGFAFQVSNTKNEILSLGNDKDFSSIDMAECENILKEVYHIDKSLSLILLKFMKTDTNGESQTFQYEVYDPITSKKLNLSYCENTTVDVYVPLNLSEEKEEVYNNLKEQGYDPFDLNDKFYREICTPYTSENGTDVLLDDREEFVYSSLVNNSLCPENCDYSEYHSNKKYIKCECGTNNTDIVTLDLDNLNTNNAYKSFLSTMKSTNYKVMRCYNLVFNFKIFCKNYGSIITLILFIAYVVFMVYYCIKNISPIKLGISKILFEEQNKENMKKSNLAKNNNNNTKKKVKFMEKSENKSNFPPKKGKIRKPKLGLNNLMTEDIDFIGETKTAKVKTKSTIDNEKKTSKKKFINNDTKSVGSRLGKRKKIDVIKKKVLFDDKEEIFKEIYSNQKKELDNFELNNLEYIEACELDKRTFCTTYWSVLKREHLALVTFVSFNDYNLFYVKLDKFLVLFCTDFTMNGLFFVHESMHKKYTNGEDFTFVQKIPQLLFTLIVSHVLDVLLCFLSMSDIHVYEIKALPKDGKNGEKIMKIMDKIRRKLLAFFIFTCLLFLFYWYFISAFCAVYQNTQKIFIRDSFISFLTSLIDPFIIYGITTILRVISLTKCCKKKCGCGIIYKISDLIPIF